MEGDHFDPYGPGPQKIYTPEEEKDLGRMNFLYGLLCLGLIVFVIVMLVQASNETAEDRRARCIKSAGEPQVFTEKITLKETGRAQSPGASMGSSRQWLLTGENWWFEVPFEVWKETKEGDEVVFKLWEHEYCRRREVWLHGKMVAEWFSG